MKLKLLLKEYKFVWILLFCLFSNFAVMGQNPMQISGTISDSNGQPLPGANIIEKGTKNGAQTDFDGNFSINVTDQNAVLQVSYLGFETKEIAVTNQTELNIVLIEDAYALDAVTLSGLRRSNLEAVKAKREATSVIESITPEDIGNFSDESVAQALQRLPGIQIQQNQTGVEGARISVRGIGPQFVPVALNGRQLLTGGSQGVQQLREFNLNVIPTEVINGAQVYKSQEAKTIENGLGGLVNFNTLRPLSAQYTDGKNFFGAVNVRNEVSDTSTELGGDNLNPRVSAILGFRNKKKTFGAYISAISSNESRFQSSAELQTNNTNGTVRIDSNNDGVFDVDDGDELIENVTLGFNYIPELSLRETERLGISAGLEFQPIENLNILVDVNVYDEALTRNNMQSRIQMNAGGANGLYGANNFWAPGSINVSDGRTINFFDGAGANTASIRNNAQGFISENDNKTIIGGLNLEYTLDKLTIKADLGLSSLETRGLIFTIGQHISPILDVSDIVFDARGGGFPNMQIGGDIIGDLSNRTPTNTQFLEINRGADGSSLNGRIDLNYDLSDRLSLDGGYRYTRTELFARTFRYIPLHTDETRAILEEQLPNYPLVNKYAEDYDPGFSFFPNIDSRQLGDLYGYTRSDDSPFFDSNLFDIQDSDNFRTGAQLTPNANQSFDFIESTTAFYGQLNLKKVDNAKFSGNIGLRVIQTNTTNRGFSSVTLTDPREDDGTITPLPNVVQTRVPSTTENSRWDVLPSLNLTYHISKNIQNRFSVSRVMSRPTLLDQIPSNTITAINPDAGIAPTDPIGVGESTVALGNPNLNPYFSWQFDNTLEFYTNSGGGFVVSGFYKSISDFIGTQVFENQTYPGADVTGLDIPAGSQEFDFTVTQAVNFSDVDLYGFEVGFNQPFTFLPGFLSGFGAQANYTFIDSNFEEDLGTGEIGDGFPGSSQHNFNSILYYDKYGLNVRLSYTARSDYLRRLPTGATARTNALIFTEGIHDLGLRVAYNFSNKFKGLQLSVSGTNITNQDRRDFLNGDTEAFRGIYDDAPLWTFGTRYRF